MLKPTSIELVKIWEEGCATGCAERAHLLLSRADPAMSSDELENLPLGLRDDLLLRLRERIFGRRLESVLSCSGCSESLEINVDIHALWARPASGEDIPAEWSDGDLSVLFRVPTGGDLRGLEGCEDREEARRRLLEGCIMQARRGEETIQPSQLRSEEAAALAERVAQADPHGELILKGDCPNCGKSWEKLLDIASFLWHELEMHVHRLLIEVHALARAYSWSERDILTMSARRRRIYLELLGR